MTSYCCDIDTGPCDLATSTERDLNDDNDNDDNDVERTGKLELGLVVRKRWGWVM